MGGRRKIIEPGHIGDIAARYLRAKGCRVLRQHETGFSATCPGCGDETYEVDLGSGKAGCVDEGCAVPEGESWIGVVAHHEDLDRKYDWDEIRRIGLTIVEEKEQALERKKAQEERADKDRRERIMREADAHRRAQEAQQRGRGGDGSHAEHEADPRYAAQDEEERRSLTARPEEEERPRQQEAKTKTQKALRQAKAGWDDRHKNACAYAIAALAPVLWTELLMGVFAGAAVLMAAYHGVGWVASWAGPDAEPAVLGATAGGGDGAGRFGQLAGRAAAASARLVAWRLPLGLVLGLSSGGLIAFFMGRGRQARHAFFEDEYLVVRRTDERREGRLVSTNPKVDLFEVSTEPLRRFVGVVVGAIEAVGEAIAWAADVLRMAEWPWPRIVVSLLLGLLVGWSVVEYLHVSVKEAAPVALLAFWAGLVALTAYVNR